MTNGDYQNIQLVSWDVDGTLFSTFHLGLVLIKRIIRVAQSKGWARTIKDLKAIIDFHRLVERQRQNPGCKVIHDQMKKYSSIQVLERQALRHALHEVQPQESALTLLRQFGAAGIIQVALSDFECGYKLEALGLSGHFQKAYSCQEIGYWKPSPLPLMNIQKDFAIQPEHHLHIGDRKDTDGEACARNGCHFLRL